MTGSSMIQEDSQRAMFFPGFLSNSGSLLPSKSKARVLPVDNKQVGT